MALASVESLPLPPIPKSLAAPRFNPRVVIGLLVLASAMLGLVAVYRAAQPRTVEVLRAAHDVQPGQVLQAADLQVVAAHRGRAARCPRRPARPGTSGG